MYIENNVLYIDTEAAKHDLEFELDNERLSRTDDGGITLPDNWWILSVTCRCRAIDNWFKRRF